MGQFKLFHLIQMSSYFSTNVDFVYLCFPLFTIVFLCLPLFTFVYLCWNDTSMHSFVLVRSMNSYFVLNWSACFKTYKLQYHLPTKEFFLLIGIQSEIDFGISIFLCQNVQTKEGGGQVRTKSEHPNFLHQYQPGENVGKWIFLSDCVGVGKKTQPTHKSWIFGGNICQSYLIIYQWLSDTI